MKAKRQRRLQNDNIWLLMKRKIPRDQGFKELR